MGSMTFRGHKADITISDVSKSQEDDGRVCRFLSSTRLWCMPCDVCCNPTFKMLFKDFFFKIFPCVVPRLRYLSSSLFLPCCLPFYPFILSRPFSSSVGKRKTVFHLNCQTFTLKYIHSLPLRTHPKSTYIFISRFSLPTLSLPVLVWLWSTSLSSRTDFVPSCERGDVWMLACCLFINLFSPSLGPDLDLSMWPEETCKSSPGL